MTIGCFGDSPEDKWKQSQLEDKDDVGEATHCIYCGQCYFDCNFECKCGSDDRNDLFEEGDL